MDPPLLIKATGDYEGIRELVTQKGIKFDPKLRDEVSQRVKAAAFKALGSKATAATDAPAAKPAPTQRGAKKSGGAR